VTVLGVGWPACGWASYLWWSWWCRSWWWLERRGERGREKNCRNGGRGASF